MPSASTNALSCRTASEGWTSTGMPGRGPEAPSSLLSAAMRASKVVPSDTPRARTMASACTRPPSPAAGRLATTWWASGSTRKPASSHSMLSVP